MEKKQVNVGDVIDSAKYFWVPFGITVMMIIIMLTDGFDLLLMGYINPDLAADLGVPISAVQSLSMASLIGMAIGSTALGWAGDRIGRKKAYIACVVLLFIGSLGCYYSSTISGLYFWRLITGLGLGGVTPLATTLVSEWTSKRVRNIVVACVIVSVPLGGTLAGFADQLLVEEHGWRVMFLVGAVVPLVLFVCFGILLPESPKYLAKHSHLHGRLAKSLNRLVGENRFDGSENFFVTEEGKRSGNWFATIWNPDFRSRTLLIWVAFAINTFVLYVFSLQMKTLLLKVGLSNDVASQGQQFFSGGAALGAIGGAFLIGAFGSRWVGTALAVMGSVAVVLMALIFQAGDFATSTLFMLLLAAGASVNGMQAFMYAVGAHSYPTEIRGSAVGMAQTFSRISAVLSPAAAGYYYAMEPNPPVSSFVLFVAGVMLLTAVSFFLIPSHIPKHTK